VAKMKSPPKSLPAKRTASSIEPADDRGYASLLSGMQALLEDARRGTARAVNSVLTATYREMGRRIVEFEQGGKVRAGYGEALLQRLADDLTAVHGRGFSERNLRQMRAFFLGWEIRQTPSAELQARVKSLAEAEQGKAGLAPLPEPMAFAPGAFPMPWSHYVRLLSVENLRARQFYEDEAIRGAWSVRQLNRQINSMFYERTALSKNKAAMLTKGQTPKPDDAITDEHRGGGDFRIHVNGPEKRPGHRLLRN
jgi:hypothetical protein